MATLRIDPDKILGNIRRISGFLESRGLRWTLVTKVLGGYRPVLERLLHDEAMDGVHSVADARLSGVRTVKEIRPDVTTLYLKPPPVGLADDVVTHADISLNTSRTTVRALDAAAGRLGRRHRIIIMVEMGERREGVLRDDLLGFYEEVRSLAHLDVVGLGTNLGCMHGVEPNYDKLMQLALFRDLIEARTGERLPLISGGSSIVLPLVEQGRMPAGVDHLRLGEAAFFGTSPLYGTRFRGLSTTAFDFCAHVIERSQKDRTPDGVMGGGGIGHTVEIDRVPAARTPGGRCIVDFGLLDVEADHLTPRDEDVRFAGATSDMTVYDVDGTEDTYPVGSEVHFTPDYIAVAQLMHSKYIDKHLAPTLDLASGDGAARAVPTPTWRLDA